MSKNIVDILCAKDEASAKEAAKHFVKNADLTEFVLLCEKMDNLFDFVRDNVYRRLKSVINEKNFKNIMKFFGHYSYYFDDFFAEILSKYANEDLTDDIIELFSKGNDFHKAYCAKYFSYIPDTVAMQNLIDSLDSIFEPLFINSAAALGKMKAVQVLEKYKSDLYSPDDFIKLKAVKFIVSFGEKNLFNELLNSLMSSSMKENIAGEIANIISPVEILKMNFEKGAVFLNSLINGLGEILSLDNVFYYEIYDVISFLFEKRNFPVTAVLLYNLKTKFEIFTENDEYIYDFDKGVKNEIYEIKALLESQSSDFWDSLKLELRAFIDEKNYFLDTVLEIIKENNIKDFVDEICALVKSDNETIVCEALIALKSLNELYRVNKTLINIKNFNLKALVEQIYN